VLRTSYAVLTSPCLPYSLIAMHGCAQADVEPREGKFLLSTAQLRSAAKLEGKGKCEGEGKGSVSITPSGIRR
jgi:hypothetical protein